MVHLIGVEHRVQYKSPHWIVTQTHRNNWDHYSSIVEQSIREIQPSVVAEELNQEILEKHNHAESLLLSIKNSFEMLNGRNVKHIFAEPCSAQKYQIQYKEDCAVRRIISGIESQDPNDELVWAHMAAHQYPIREQFWIDMIEDHLNSDVLFVCGDAHIDTFPMLLERKDIAYKVIHRGIGMPPVELIESKGVRYAKQIGLFGTTDCPCLK